MSVYSDDDILFQADEEEDYEDEYDENEEEYEDKKTRPRKKRRGLKVFIAFLLIIVIGTGGIFSVFRLKKEKPRNNEDFVESDELDDRGAHLKAFRNCRELNEHLKLWSDMTEEKDLMKSDDVINFLIIGADLEEYNADVIMLVSLNKATKKIYLTSIMRDCYTYIPTSTESHFAKINSAYGIGGADKLIDTVQRDFKVKIDYYTSINFQSFIEIVDEMGGIDLNVPDYLAEAIGNGCPSGNNVHLNGTQALKFVRIRHTDADADVSRTRRQREFISAVIDRSREVKLSQLVSVFGTILKYVKTDCPTTQLIKFATQGIISRWYAYSIVSNSYPLENDRLDYQGDSWVWIVDYPSSAKNLQEMVYGKTNINLGTDRVSAIDIVKARINKEELQ